MKLEYRTMVVDDLPAAFTIRLSTVENSITMEALEKDYDITPESLADALTSDVKGWICEESGTAVGFSVGDRSNGELQVVAVLPEFESNGIGKRLLSLGRDWLFSQGYREIWLRSNPDPKTRAYGFYRKLGWQATGKVIGNDEFLVFRSPEV